MTDREKLNIALRALYAIKHMDTRQTTTIDKIRVWHGPNGLVDETPYTNEPGPLANVALKAILAIDETLPA